MDENKENLKEMMTKEEKKSSLIAQFWNDNEEVDKTSKFYKEIQELCKEIDFTNK